MDKNYKFNLKLVHNTDSKKSFADQLAKSLPSGFKAKILHKILETEASCRDNYIHDFNEELRCSGAGFFIDHQSTSEETKICFISRDEEPRYLSISGTNCDAVFSLPPFVLKMERDVVFSVPLDGKFVVLSSNNERYLSFVKNQIETDKTRTVVLEELKKE